MHVCERHQIATCLPLFIHLVLAPPQPAETLERVQVEVEKTTGEVTQDDGSQYCEGMVACLLFLLFVTTSTSRLVYPYDILHRSDQRDTVISFNLN